MRGLVVTVLLAFATQACGGQMSGSVTGGSNGLVAQGEVTAATTTMSPSGTPEPQPSSAESSAAEADESPSADADESPSGEAEQTRTPSESAEEQAATTEAEDTKVDAKIPNVSRFEPAAEVEQAVVVKSTSWSNTVVAVETWVRDDSSSPWTLQATGSGRVGYNGIKANREHGDGATPAGMFRILWGFGPGSNPNSRGMTWRTFDDDDYWVGDPEHAPSYNTYQTSPPGADEWRTSEAERLWSYRTLYEYAWVIDYNRPRYGTRPASEPQPILSGPGSGNAIFLHVQGSGATAGCVSIPLSRIQSLSGWFDESKNPIIIIGEDDWLQG